MAPLPIIEYPDPVLRKNARAVTVFDTALQLLTQDLTDTLYSTTGIGLCAPQVGHSLQLLIMDLSEDQSQPEVFINPEIIAKSGLAIAEERCLSIPGIVAKVIRAGVIQIKAKDVHGNEFERELEGMSAICLQHEIDHLHGTLFIDRISRLRRLRFRGVLKTLENAQKQALSPAI